MPGYGGQGSEVWAVMAARFIHEVVVELLIRDVEGLVERYLRKMRKAFARMEWEDEQQAAATGNDRPASPLMMT